MRRECGETRGWRGDDKETHPRRRSAAWGLAAHEAAGSCGSATESAGGEPGEEERVSARGVEELYQILDGALGLSVEPRELHVGQMIARGLVIFVAALAMLRSAHKRFFARRNALDVLLTLVIASTLARAINGDAAFFPTIVVGFVLVLTHRAVTWAAARSEKIGNLVKGRATALIEDGRVNDEKLRAHDLARKDLEEDLRINGVESPQEVKRATLERNGEVSVVKS